MPYLECQTKKLQRIYHHTDISRSTIVQLSINLRRIAAGREFLYGIEEIINQCVTWSDTRKKSVL